METFLHNLGTGIMILATTLAGWLGVEQPLGVSLPGGQALFETSLQERISSTDSSMTLVENELTTGESLSGYQCFTIDEGRSDAEFICGTISGTTVASLERGISASTATSTVAAARFPHRRGATVKITDYPLIQRLRNLSNGIETFPNLLQYSTTTTVCSVSSSNFALCDKAYMDGLAVAGASNANETTKGISELATAAELAAGTSLGGTSARLVIPNSLATSSPTASCSTFCVVVAAAGKIAQAFLDLAANFIWTGQHTFNGNSGVSTTTVNNDLKIATSTQFGVYGGLSPTGSITAYASTTAPAGWLLADGASVLRSDYPQLFAVIGTSYGAADATHFTLPDLKRRNILMASSTPNVGQTGGQSNHTMTTEELVAHTHSINSRSGAGGTMPSTPTAAGEGAYDTSFPSLQAVTTGGGTPFNVLDPYIVLQYIIKY